MPDPEFVQARVPAPAWERVKGFAETAGVSASQLCARLITETLDVIDAPSEQMPPIIIYLRSLKAQASGNKPSSNIAAEVTAELAKRKRGLAGPPKGPRGFQGPQGRGLRGS